MLEFQPKIVVLGVGNLLLRDEGVGIHFVQSLNKDDLLLKADSYRLSIIDGGTSPEIISLVEGAAKLIIIDAVKGGKKGGTIYRFSSDDINLDSPVRLSLHQMGIVDSLKLLKAMGKQPKSVVIIGIEPKKLALGLKLSPEIEEKLPELKRLLIQEIKEVE